MGEVNLYGIYVPILLIQSIIAYGLLQIIMLASNRLVERGWILWPSIFHLCLYILLLFLVYWLFL